MKSVNVLLGRLIERVKEADVFDENGEIVDPDSMNALMRDEPMKIIVVAIHEWKWSYMNKPLAECMNYQAGWIQAEDENHLRYCFDPAGFMYFHTVYQHYLQGGNGSINAVVAIQESDENLISLEATSAMLLDKNGEKSNYYIHAFWDEKDAKLMRGLALAGVENLSPRQTEVFRLLVMGVSSDLIAQRLGISGKTLEKHLLVIYRTTQCQNRTVLLKACAS